MIKDSMLSIDTDAQNFIERIKRGEIRREYLANFSEDFSKENEEAILTQFDAYLRSLSYAVAKRGDLKL